MEETEAQEKSPRYGQVPQLESIQKGMKGTWGYGGEMSNNKPEANSIVCVLVYAWSWLSEALDH